MDVMMDTGPWVALIDRSERRHIECIEWFKNFRGNILSSEAVLTEVLYLLNFFVKSPISSHRFCIEWSHPLGAIKS